MPLSGPVDFEIKPGSLRRNAQRTAGDLGQGLGSQLETRPLKEGLENIGGKETQQNAHKLLRPIVKYKEKGIKFLPYGTGQEDETKTDINTLKFLLS